MTWPPLAFDREHVVVAATAPVEAPGGLQYTGMILDELLEAAFTSKP